MDGVNKSVSEGSGLVEFSTAADVVSPRSMYVLHSAYPDGTWRGLEKCVSAEGASGPLLFESPEEAAAYVEEKRLIYRRVVQVTVFAPEVRGSLLPLDFAMARHSRETEAGFEARAPNFQEAAEMVAAAAGSFVRESVVDPFCERFNVEVQVTGDVWGVIRKSDRPEEGGTVVYGNAWANEQWDLDIDGVEYASYMGEGWVEACVALREALEAKLLGLPVFRFV